MKINLQPGGTVKKILIVEDEEIVRSNIAEILESENFEVIETDNGISAIKSLENSLPDLIISDIMMPGIDGYDLVKYIQSNPVTSGIPIILLTARSETRDIRMGMQYGADDYITKPFKANDLISAVKTRLQKQSNFKQKFDDLKSNISMYIPHELRTPLVSILGFADLIINNLDDLEKREIKEMAEKVKHSGLRLYDRIEKFLYFAELELNKTENKSIDKTQIDSMYVTNLLTSKFRNNDVSLLSIKIDEAELKISQDYLSRILIELVDNAYKFMHSSSPIIISGEVIGNTYQILVIDKGMGMTKDEEKQITAFKQFNREQNQQEGNGLGLAIVKNIVKLADGNFEINSKKDEGTEVKINLGLAS
ncbi:MAG: hybrid sensor histidine kinase/response regulator [Ignavibacteriales bacterium]|nr:MAG: hybrid sensor histidine kinase/response regulator [Ignavibacteriales bacterium]